MSAPGGGRIPPRRQRRRPDSQLLLRAPPDDRGESTRRRLAFLALLLVVVFGLLFARLWFLQVMAGEEYVAAAQTNAVREVAVAAPRGAILDHNGEPLVSTRYATVISVQPSQMGGREDEVLADLADLLGLPLDELRRRIEQSRVSPLQPKPVAIDVPDELVLYLHEHRATRYPGVYAENLPRRSYPQGALAAHVVGYPGEVPEADVEEEDPAGPRPGQQVGLTGLERAYDSVLRGVDGERRLEVNRSNVVVSELPGRPPEPGADLVTAIDLHAQQVAEAALSEGIARARQTADGSRGGTFAAPAGAVVVLDPRDGSVRALASYPTYDPSEFVGGVSTDYWNWLRAEEQHNPLLNRAISSSYPPGSVFKIVSAAAALQRGYMTPTSRLPCPGQWHWGQVFRNWNPRDSGSMNLAQALVHSCDTVFYELARRMYLDEEARSAAGQPASEALGEQARAWGLGAPLGIDLPGEAAGVVPGREWREAFHEQAKATYCEKAVTLPPGYARDINADLCENGGRWRGGDAVNMSIGQGDVQTTPLQIAAAYGAMANGGTLYQPQVADRVHYADGRVDDLPPKALGAVPLDPAHLAYLESGLFGVTEPGGTAGSVFGDFPVLIAGKTGTAEMKPKQPYAWFAGYTPDPVNGEQYVVVAMVEEGGGGSQTAAPIVRRIFEGLLNLEATALEPGAVTD